MDIKLVVLFGLLIIVGVVLMLNNRTFYKRSSATMLLPAELKLFLGGVMLCIIGCWGLWMQI